MTIKAKHIDPLDRLAPHSLECEMCALSSMLLSPEIRPAMLALLRDDDFFLTDHNIICKVIRWLSDESRPIDAVILRDELKKRNLLDEIGGAAYIAQILSAVPSAAHGMEYAARVSEKARRRFLILFGDHLSRCAYDESRDVQSLAEKAMKALTKHVKRFGRGTDGDDHAAAGNARPAVNVVREERQLPAAGIRGAVVPRSGMDGQRDRSVPRPAGLDGNRAGPSREKSVA